MVEKEYIFSKMGQKGKWNIKMENLGQDSWKMVEQKHQESFSAWTAAVLMESVLWGCDGTLGSTEGSRLPGEALDGKLWLI